MILVPLLNPKFATVLAAKSCELRVRGTRALSFEIESRISSWPGIAVRRTAPHFVRSSIPRNRRVQIRYRLSCVHPYLATVTHKFDIGWGIPHEKAVIWLRNRCIARDVRVTSGVE